MDNFEIYGISNNALFVELDEGTNWTMFRSTMTNINGDVTHDINYSDLIGKETPRGMDAEDISFGPHYLVIDLNKNLIVDFASYFNYWYIEGGRTFSCTFTATNI